MGVACGKINKRILTSKSNNEKTEQVENIPSNPNGQSEADFKKFIKLETIFVFKFSSPIYKKKSRN